MDIVNYRTAETKNALTSRAGLLLAAEQIRAAGLSPIIDRLLPRAGRGRAYAASAVISTFMLMLHDGARCLEDVRLLRRERPLMRMIGLARLPTAHTLGNWLHALGVCEHARRAVVQVNRHLLARGLGRRKRVTLDIDATVIEAHKKGARYSYKKCPGYVPMVGHIAETEQVAAVEFRPGNAPPSKDNLGFIRQCMDALPAGVRVSHVRIDAAGYQAVIVNFCEAQGMRFAIRAKMDTALRDSMSAVREADWQPLACRDGTVSKTEQVARTLHCMADTDQAFVIVAQRQRKAEAKADSSGAVQTTLLPQLLGQVDEESVQCSRYLYRAIATNLDQDGLDDHQIVGYYNQRAECSENRIKELRSDFGGARLPCSDFDANAAYFMMCMLAYNLLALMRLALPPKWESSRAVTLRHRLYASAGQVVRHARQWTLRIERSRRREIDEALRAIRKSALA